MVGLTKEIRVGFWDDLFGDWEICIVSWLSISVKNGIKLVHPTLHLLLQINDEEVDMECYKLFFVRNFAEKCVSGCQKNDWSSHEVFSTIIEKLSHEIGTFIYLSSIKSSQVYFYRISFYNFRYD